MNTQQSMASGNGIKAQYNVRCAALECFPMGTSSWVENVFRLMTANISRLTAPTAAQK